MAVNENRPGFSEEIFVSPNTFKMMEQKMLEAALSQADLISTEEVAESNYFVPPGSDNFKEFFIANEHFPTTSKQGKQPAEGISEDMLAGSKLKWLDHQVKFLLSLVEELREKVGKTAKLSSKKKMWAEIERKFSEKGYCFTAGQIEAKYRALERQYKKCKTNNKLTGRNRLKCPFEDEMTAILGNRPAINPEKLLGRKRKSVEITDTAANIEETTVELPSTSNTTSTQQSFDNILREGSESRESDTPRKKKPDLCGELRQLREVKENYLKKALEMKEAHYKKQEELRERHYKRKEELKEKKLDILKSILEELKK